MKFFKKCLHIGLPFALLFIAGITVNRFHAPPSPVLEGLYQMCAEVQGYSGETLQLRAGTFRYWFYSDVKGVDEPKYPISGTYEVHGSTLILNHPDMHTPTRTVDSLNGVAVLWRDDGLEYWKQERRIQPYAVLIHQPEGQDGDLPPERPSLKRLYTPEMEARDRQEREERFNDKPEPVRSLLRLSTGGEDPDRSSIRAEFRKARNELDPRLVQQLIGLMGYDNPMGIRARLILEEIFQGSEYPKEEAPFKKGTESHARALNVLIEGLKGAKDRNALEHGILIFLRVSEIWEVDLTIPEGGVRIRLKANPAGGYSTDSTSSGLAEPPKNYRWTERMGVIVPACQEWARERIRK